MDIRFLLSSRKHSPQQAEKAAQRAGFDGIELVLPEKDTNERLKEYTQLRTVRAVHAAVGNFTVKAFTAALERAKVVAQQQEVQSGHKVRRLIVHPGSLNQGGRENVKSCIYASRMPEFTVCYEVPPASHKLTHKLRQAYHSVAQWAADVHDYGLNGVLDTTHVASWGENPAAWIPLLGSRLAHVHVSDYDYKTREQHLFIGAGNIAFSDFFQRLKHRCPGRLTPLYVTLEPAGRFDLCKHAGNLRESLSILRRGLGE